MESAAVVSPFRDFRLGQSRPDERLKGPDTTLLKQLGAAPDICKTVSGRTGMQLHPPLQEGAESDPQSDAMLMRDARHRAGERGRAIDPPGDDLEHGAVHQAVGRGREMAQSCDSRRRRVGKLAGAVDFAERPERDRQIDGCGNADVLAEAEGEIAIPLWIENRRRLFEMRARLHVVPGEPLGHAIGAMGDPSLGRTGP